MFTDAACGAGPVGPDRRGFLKELGLGSIALASLVADQKASGAGAVPAVDLSDPLAPRQPHFTPKARNVIFLFMVGGASQIETFDHKPLLKKYGGKEAKDIFPKEDLDGLNPSKTFYTSQIVPPVFSFKRYGQSGAWVSEIFPHLTKVVDDITFIKSMYADVPIHGPGQILMHTGYSRQGHPSLGSWVTYGLGTENRNMPGFVVMTDGRSDGGRALYDSGFLPGYHQATLADVTPGNPPVPHIEAPAFLNPGQHRQQLNLLRKLNRLHRGMHPTQPELDARIAAFETAFRMQMEAPDLFDIRNEPDSVKALYGDHRLRKEVPDGETHGGERSPFRGDSRRRPWAAMGRPRQPRRAHQEPPHQRGAHGSGHHRPHHRPEVTRPAGRDSRRLGHRVRPHAV